MAECKDCIHNKVCSEVNSLKCRKDFIWYDAQSGCPYFTADVVPKSEVENFNKSKGGFCPLYGSYTITQEMMEELRMEHKEQGQHGDPVGEKGVNALEAIKAEVAREIFEDIAQISCRIGESDGNGNTRILCYQLSSEKLAELKKKYTEGTE